MQDPRQLYQLDPDLPDLTGAVMLHQFDGFLDAGSAGEGVTRHLLQEFDSRVIATFDADQLIDYRSRRPNMLFSTDHWEAYTQPEIVLHLMRDDRGTPFLLLTGREPDTQWERFVSAVIGIVGDLGVSKVIGLHGIPMGSPHTRQLGVTSHGTSPHLLHEAGMWGPGKLQVPGSVSSLLEYRLGQAGYDALGFAVHVPHYLAESTYPSASVTLLEHISTAAGLTVPDEELRETARQVNAEVDEQVRNSTEVSDVVEALERQFDMFTESAARRSLLADNDGRLPTADELGTEFERFLAEQPDQRDDRRGFSA
ncbi:PAC2 family protein [Stackebrandtia soli]|uniref:PAC2 family protein n=1 Tax=Stackebrandtia soli TaxID=1892856 RepID=UPI0039EBA5DF